MHLTLQDQKGDIVQIDGTCVAKVEALNHDDTVRCVMSLYQTSNDFVCQRIDEPETENTWYRLERCNDELEIYQFFGTEPLANYLYGRAGIEVPGLRNTK